MDLVSLYAGYAAGAIERDRLFGEVTARNRVLETIREILETLAADPVPTSLLRALQSLHRGLRATEIELWVKELGGVPRCGAFIDADNHAHRDLLQRDGADAISAFSAPNPLRGPSPFEVRGPRPRDRHDFRRAERTSCPCRPLVALRRARRRRGPTRGRGELGAPGPRARRSGGGTPAGCRAASLPPNFSAIFLSRLSHELRTPLTAIRGYASSLLASDVTWDDQSKPRFLNRIEGESSRLGRLVGDLLDFSAIESGLLRLQQDWCDLPLVIAAAVSCLHPDGAEAVTVSCPPEIGPLWADHDRLEQVFVNLLDNALRHNSPWVKSRSRSPGRGRTA